MSAEYPEFPCPNCARELRIKPEHVGVRVLCKYCDHHFRVPRRVTIACPECGHDGRIRTANLGRLMRCTECQFTFRSKAAPVIPRGDTSALEIQLEKNRIELTDRTAERDNLLQKVSEASQEADLLRGYVHDLQDQLRAARSGTELGAIERDQDEAKTRLDVLRISLAERETAVSALESQLSAARETTRELENRLAASESRNAAIESAIADRDALRREHSDVQSRLEMLEPRALESERLTKEVERLRSELASANDEISHTRRQSEISADEHRRNSLELESVRAERTKLVESIENAKLEATQSANSHASAIAALRDEVEGKSLEVQRLNSKTAELNSVAAKLAELQEQTECLRSENDGLVQEVERLRRASIEHDSLRAAHSRLLAEIDTARQERDERDRRIEGLSAAGVQVEALARDVDAARRNEERLTSELARSVAESAALRSKNVELERQLGESEARSIELDSVRAEYKRSLSEVESLRAAGDQSRHRINELCAAVAQIETLTSERDAARVERETIAQDRDKLVDELSRLHASSHELESLQESLKTEAAEEASALREHLDQLGACLEQERVSHQVKCQELSSELAAKDQLISDAVKEKDAFATELGGLRSELERMKSAQSDSVWPMTRHAPVDIESLTMERDRAVAALQRAEAERREFELAHRNELARVTREAELARQQSMSSGQRIDEWVRQAQALKADVDKAKRERDAERQASQRALDAVRRELDAVRSAAATERQRILSDPNNAIRIESERRVAEAQAQQKVAAEKAAALESELRAAKAQVDALNRDLAVSQFTYDDGVRQERSGPARAGSTANASAASSLREEHGTIVDELNRQLERLRRENAQLSSIIDYLGVDAPTVADRNLR